MQWNTFISKTPPCRLHWHYWIPFTTFVRNKKFRSYRRVPAISAAFEFYGFVISIMLHNVIMVHFLWFHSIILSTLSCSFSRLTLVDFRDGIFSRIRQRRKVFSFKRQQQLKVMFSNGIGVEFSTKCRSHPSIVPPYARCCIFLSMMMESISTVTGMRLRCTHHVALPPCVSTQSTIV